MTLTYNDASAAADDGQRLLKNGNLALAEADFRLSTGIEDANADAVLGLAQTLDREGKSAEAITVYRYLLNPKPHWNTSMEQDPALRMHFAELLVENNEWSEAVDVYESTIGDVHLGAMYPPLDLQFDHDRIQSTDFLTAIHLSLGITHNLRGENPEALVEYKTALSYEPDSALTNF